MRSAALLAAATLVAAGCGWSQYRAGSEGTGYNAVESKIGPANAAQLELAWSRPVGWIVPGSNLSGPYPGDDGLSPIARNGADLVVASPEGSVVLDAETGALRFPVQYEFPDRDDDQSAAAVDGRIVLSGYGNATPRGRISVHDLATGEEIWNVTGSLGGPSAPVIAGDRVYFTYRATVGTHPTILQVMGLNDRSLEWTAGGCCDPSFAPVVAGDTVYFRQTDPPAFVTQLSALDAATGAVRWSVPSESTTCETAPVVSGGRVYASGVTFNAANGAKLWDWPTCAATSIVTVTPDTLYVPYRSSSGASRLQAVNAETGAVRWSIPWNQNAVGKPSVPAAANGLLFSAGGNKLVARRATDGTVLWRSPGITGTFSEPIVTDGMVYAVATDGAVHAYRLS